MRFLPATLILGLVIVVTTMTLESVRGESEDLEEDPSQEVNCNICGAPCMTRCGTKRFRACCLRYVRKRMIMSDHNDGSSGSSNRVSNMGLVSLPLVLHWTQREMLAQEQEQNSTV